MTNQQAFNAVWKHFILELNPPAYDEEGSHYHVRRDGQDRWCAIGILLPERYRYSDLPDTINELIDRDMGLVRLFKDCRIRLLMDLQRAHDYAAREAHEHERPFTWLMRRQLEYIARAHQLEVPR